MLFIFIIEYLFKETASLPNINLPNDTDQYIWVEVNLIGGCIIFANSHHSLVI